MDTHDAAYESSSHRAQVGVHGEKDEHVATIKHKVRLSAKGYVQRVGLHFEVVFAPMARLESMRLILALAAHRGWEVHHMNVKSAFLNADLDEEVLPSSQASSLASMSR